MATNQTPLGTRFHRILLSTVLIVSILYLAKAVLVPLALAILLTFVLAPIVTTFQRLGIGRIPAVFVTVVLALGLFVGVGWGVGVQVNKLVQELPDHKEKIKKKIDDLRAPEDGALARFLEMVREISEEPKTPVVVPPLAAMEKTVVIARAEESSNVQKLTYIVVPVLEPLATAGLVVILVIFMLSSREDLRNRLIGLLGHGHLTGTTRVIVDAAERLSAFLLTQLVINVGFGAVFGAGLILIGVPYAFLWGFLTALLRFIPYIGTWISVAFPLIVSFALAPDWTQPVLVLVFFALMDFIVASFIEPVLFGHRTGVTPIALLIAAAFWTWIWGAIGLVLSTPLTVCLVVLGQHVPRFKVFVLLLGDQPALKTHITYYQRLLSRDVEEAQELAAAYAGEQGPESVFDDVLLPALILARQDRQQEGLSQEDEDYILQATMEVLEGLGAEAEAPIEAGADTTADAASPARPLILACPTHQRSEELSLHMLARLMKPDGCHVEVLSSRTLPMELEKRIAAEDPAVVVIAVLPPGGMVQVRYLCTRLRRRFPDLPIIIGYWGPPRNYDLLLVHLRAAGATYVTTSLLQVQSRIRSLISTTPADGSSQAVPTAGPLPKSLTQRTPATVADS